MTIPLSQALAHEIEVLRDEVAALLQRAEASECDWRDAKADVKALAEALRESECLLSEIHDRVWTAHEINRPALARDGVRRGREQGL